MDRPTSGCPDRSILKAWLQGLLEVEQEDFVASHVEDCTGCDETIQSMEAETDTGFRLPPGIADASESVEEANYSNLLGDLKAIPLKVRADDLALSREHTTAVADDLSGTTLGQYELQGVIGRGGMGKVYKARHRKLDRIVALKVLPESSFKEPMAIKRFEREIRAAGRLKHPNVVQALDADEVDGTHFLVMEFIDGTDLGKITKVNGPLPIDHACNLTFQAAQGLQAIHESGLVHRDIKPSNLIVDSSGTVHILDLGLALLGLDQESSHELTSTDQIMGTVDYIAPEQAMDTHNVDIRADIYSLGCTLFHLLTGKPPYRNDNRSNAFKTMTAHANEPIPDIRSLREDVSSELAQVVEQLLAKNPDDRPQSPAEVSELLASFASTSKTLVTIVTPHCTSSETADELAAGRDTLAGHRNSERTVQADASPLWQSNEHHNSPKRAINGTRGILLVAIALVGIISTYAVSLLFKTAKGSVEVTIDDSAVDDIKVQLVQGERVLIVSKQNNWQISASPGEYDVRLLGGTDQFQINKEIIRVSRDQTEIVRVIRKSVGKDESPTESPKWFDDLPRTVQMLLRDRNVNINDESLEVWYYFRPDRTGVFVGAGSNWKEFTSTSLKASFDLVTRNTESVELVDEGRVRVRIYDDRCEAQNAGSTNWYLLHKGKWGHRTTAPPPAKSPHEIARFPLHRGIAFVGSGRELALIDKSGRTLQFWDTRQRNSVRSYPDQSSRQFYFRYQAGKDLLWMTGFPPSVVAMNRQTGRAALELKEATGHNHALAISPSKNLVATGGSERRIWVWNTETGQLVADFVAHTEVISGLDFSPDGSTLASSSHDGTVRLWAVDSWDEVKILKIRGASVMETQFSPDGKRLFAVGSDRLMYVWELSDFTQNSFDGPDGVLWDADFIYGGRIFVTAGADSRIRFWDASTYQQIVNVPRPKSGSVSDIEFAEDESIMAMVVDDGEGDLIVHVWRIPDAVVKYAATPESIHNE